MGFITHPTKAAYCVRVLHGLDSERAAHRDFFGEIERTERVECVPTDLIPRFRWGADGVIDQVDMLMVGADLLELDTGWGYELYW